MTTILIDFDGPIFDGARPPEYATEALEEFKTWGWNVVINAQYTEDRKQLVRYCRTHRLPYSDLITKGHSPGWVQIKIRDRKDFSWIKAMPDLRHRAQCSTRLALKARAWLGLTWLEDLRYA